MDMEFGDILAGEAGRGGEPQDKGMVDVRAGMGNPPGCRLAGRGQGTG